MLAGRRFRLREPIVAAALENDGRTVAWLVPSSSVIEIISRTASGLRMLDVLWDDRILAMPESDIAERGDELFEQPVGAHSAMAVDYVRPQAQKVMRAASF
jgi:hypothetical protein